MKEQGLSDAGRFKKLYRHHILGTPPEESFDKIARLAASLVHSSYSVIVFATDDGVYFKSANCPEELIQSTQVHEFFKSLILNNQQISSQDLEDKNDCGFRFLLSLPLKFSDGSPMGAMVAFDEKEIEVSADQLKTLSTLTSIVEDKIAFRTSRGNAIRAHTDLMNIAIHDIKNPLTTIRLYAQLIQRESSEQKQISEKQISVGPMADRILASVEHIQGHLNDLMNLSQIEDGEMKLRIEACTLGYVMEELISGYQVVLENKQQRVSYVNTLDRQVLADRNRIREVFDNLLSNASKYSDAGSEIVIKIWNADESTAMIEFRDSGQGLHEEDMKKVFTKFARLSSIPTGKETSNGLGLSIAKILVELHNGKIWVESAGKGRGSSFFVKLPLVQ